MNSQSSTQLGTAVFVLLFAFTLSPISLALHISAIVHIHLLIHTPIQLTASTSLPCTYITEKDEPNTFLEKLDVTVTPSGTLLITDPVVLTQEQKEAAFPFLTQEPPQSKSSPSSKVKALGRFIKQLAKATPTKACIKSSSNNKAQKNIKKTEMDRCAPNECTEEVAPAMNGHTAALEINSSAASSAKSDSLSMSSSSSLFEIDNSAVEYAQRIWDQDGTVYNNNLDHVVEWIGNGKDSSNAILKAYLEHFDFKGLKLEQAFRNLCSKLHLKGETQQIDRILSEFAGRYFQCNPKCIFGSTDVVHAIVYSLLLLNTDLHVAQGDYKKMSRSAFVKNTMSAIHAQLNTPALGDEDMLSDDHRASGLSFQSLDWIPLQRTPSNQSAFSSRSSTYAQSIDSSMPRNVSTATACTFGSKAWQLEIKNLLKQIYTNIRHSQIANPSSSPPTSIQNNRVSAAFKRSMGTIIWKGARDSIMHHDEDMTCSPPSASIASAQSASSIMQYQTVASHLQTDLPVSYTSNAPYYKEGMVVRKHLLEKAHQKAKHRDWKDCFMVIERSQLRMYKLDQSSEHRKRNIIRNTILTKSASLSDSASQNSESSVSEVVGGGDWMASAQLIGSIDLKHTLANALPSGYSRQRLHAFALQQSNGAVFLFQVGSAEQVQEWVSTCNYWAARESKEPLAGAVSSMEYGWGHCLEETGAEVTIHEWQAPVQPTMSSLLEESAQLNALHKHVQELSNELDQHRDIKPKMELRFASLKSGAKAMANWETKSHYLLHEIIKYQNYCDSIEKSLAFQDKIMSACTI